MDFTPLKVLGIPLFFLGLGFWLMEEDENGTMLGTKYAKIGYTYLHKLYIRWHNGKTENFPKRKSRKLS